MFACALALLLRSLSVSSMAQIRKERKEKNEISLSERGVRKEKYCFPVKRAWIGQDPRPGYIAMYRL